MKSTFNYELDVCHNSNNLLLFQDVLLPYVKENVQSYLNDQWDEDECKSKVQALRDQVIFVHHIDID